MHKFRHHKQKLPDIFASYFTENSLNCLIYHYNNRGESNLYVAPIQSEFGRRLLTHKGSFLWNKLPDNLKIMYSTSELKEKLRHLLYSKLGYIIHILLSCVLL